jgi:hypothetical protein
MEKDLQKMQDKLRELAEMKANKTIVPQAKKQAEMTLKDIGITPEEAATMLGAAKIGHDLSQGEVNLEGDSNVLGGRMTAGIKYTPEEKLMRLGYKRNF